MDSALTRTQFALDALVAAGHVSQAKVDAALALFPAPAGEPEMPKPDTHCIDDDTGKDVWSHSPSQFKAWGDARAEHARRVAMEDAALIVDAEEDNAREERYHPGLVGALSACAAAIRAAAPPQGEKP